MQTSKVDLFTIGIYFEVGTLQTSVDRTGSGEKKEKEVLFSSEHTTLYSLDIHTSLFRQS